MVIMPLIIGALFYAIFVTLQSEAGVSTKVADSVDSQISSEFYVRDVQSATLITLNNLATTPPVCGSGTKLLVSLAWPSGTATGKTVVSYWTKSGGTTLVREACKTGPSRPSTTTSRDFSASIKPAQIACVSAAKTKCEASTPTPAHPKWIPAQWVSTVTIAIAEPKGKYRYDLSAAPRISNATGSTIGTPPGGGVVTETLPTLFLLATGRVLKVDAAATGGTSVTVKGTTAIVTGGYITQAPNTTFRSTKVETTGPITGICKTTKTCKGTFTPHKTKWVPVPKLINPLATLPDPPEETLGTDNGCPTHTVTALGPGLYTCKIMVKKTTTLKLASGAYEFEQNVSLVNAKLTGTSGVFIYFPCSTVDTWAPSCSEGLVTAGGTTTLDVTAMKTGLYAGFWFWQNAGDQSKIALHAGTTLHASGIMYAPSAIVTLNGGVGTNAVGSVIAATLELKQGHFKITGF